MWVVFLFGLISITSNCEGRAVNISNTWTLPQDGFNVFYRFFRDQISWFEADAVCQFHHANLVTVDNSYAFDASKNFLKELDVSETVWIGLMRSQSSDKFSWSNSKYLLTSSENWADPLPLIDSPLCAVIDSVRDYRWHALRCGGPETASFLCEMNVPSWAEECILQNIPSLTIQYMADSGTVEITKDCGNDEGPIRHVCKGKQDRDEIIKNLRCKNEQQSILTTQSANLINTHQETLEIIKKISSDNNEDNSIDTQAIVIVKTTEQSKVIENPVQKIIEQFKAEELMQGDEPQKAVIIEDGKTLETKKSNKKANLNFDKKLKNRKQKKYNDNLNRGRNIDDMMMGDQPILGDDDVMDLNQIQEPLPHQKKMMPTIIKHEEDEKLARDKLEKNNGRNAIPIQEIIPTSSIAPQVTSTLANIVTVSEQKLQIEEQNKSENTMLDEEIKTTTSNILELSTDKNAEVTIMDVTTISSETVTLNAVEPKTATIGHPMHPQQPRSNIISEETGHHKETNDNHFIPPMLMVKSHYITPKLNANHDAENIEKSETSTVITETNNDSNKINNLDLTTISEISETTESNILEKLISTSTENIQKETTQGISGNPNTYTETTTPKSESIIPVTKQSETAHNISGIVESDQTHESLTKTKSKISELLSFQLNQEFKQNAVTKNNEITIDTTNIPIPTESATKINIKQDLKQELETTTTSSQITSSTVIPTIHSTILSQKITETISPETTKIPTSTSISDDDLAPLAPEHIADDVNFEDDNSQSYFKPNRRRSLTHAEQGGYLKKILG